MSAQFICDPPGTEPEPVTRELCPDISDFIIEDACCDTISALQAYGLAEVLRKARRLCASEFAYERRLGVNILDNLAESERILAESRDWQHDELRDTREDEDTLLRHGEEAREAVTTHEEVLHILLPMLAAESELEVLESIVFALGHYPDIRSVSLLKALSVHLDQRIRAAAAHSLAGIDHAQAITTLVTLSRDEDAGVRDWATHSLAQLVAMDNEVIRDALFARLNDADEDIRGEAMIGLARRGDERIVDVLVTQSPEDHGIDYYSVALVEAGKRIGDPRLFPVLSRQKEQWHGVNSSPFYGELLQAISQCAPTR